MVTALQIIAIGLTVGFFGPRFPGGQEPPSAPKQVRPEPDRVRITITPAMRDAIRFGFSNPSPRAPRVILLLAEADGPIGDIDPLDAPFFRRPQPIRSIPFDLSDLDEGIEISERSPELSSVPDDWSRLAGRFKIRAVVDLGLGRDHTHPGHPASAVSIVELAPDRSDVLDLVVDRRSEVEVERRDSDDLVWIERPSPMLTAALGRPISHRAGVVLPPAYRDADQERRFWPVIYRIPGFGGDHTSALEIAEMYRDPTLRHSIPEAVWIVLDPEDVLGHHGFVDGDNMGPRGTALVEEFMPWLGRRFRLVDDPRARILYGHSSGGWSALWLLVQHPDTFGSAFASAPDPVDFSRFGTVDLYRSTSIFEDESQDEYPSYRRPISPDLDRVAMTIREEVEMEEAIAPELRSGEQWGAWNAMFSGRDPRTARPLLGFDPESGTIDREVVDRDWSRFDLTARVRADPVGTGRILRERARILCGDRDSFYLERAVESLQAALDAVGREHSLPQGPGYVQIIPNATHGSVAGTAMQRWMREISEIASRSPLR